MNLEDGLPYCFIGVYDFVDKVPAYAVCGIHLVEHLVALLKKPEVQRDTTVD